MLSISESDPILIESGKERECQKDGSPAYVIKDGMRRIVEDIK